jgi:hypothetical protein
MLLLAITLFTLTIAVDASVVRGRGCNFNLTSAGGTVGKITQSSDGQNRIESPELPDSATYTMGREGEIFDQNGRGCVLTSSTMQLRCETDIRPTPGFSIGCDGTLSYKDGSNFVACLSTDGGWNIHIQDTASQTSCVGIQLRSDSCFTDCTGPSSPPPLPLGPSTPAVQQKACAANLSQEYHIPNLIVPTSSTRSDFSHGPSSIGRVSRLDIQSVFNFDMPTSDAGKTCSLVFLFPRQDQLRQSSFTINGDGNVGFAALTGAVGHNTTHMTVPNVSNHYGVLSLSPGNAYTVATFECQAGQTQSYSMAAADTDFQYLQDTDIAP